MSRRRIGSLGRTRGLFGGLALLVCVFALTPVPAANGTKGITVTHGQMIQVSPAAPIIGDNLTFIGCGYEAGVGAGIVVTSPGGTAWFGAIADASGCFDSSATETYTALQAGSYEVQSYQSNQHHADASLKFAVG